jgi:hypothetical protein
MKADIISALWIVLVALIGIWGWRTIGGVLLKTESTESLGKAMVAISG